MPDIRKDLLGGYEVSLKNENSYLSYNNSKYPWTNERLDKCEAQQAIELEWNHPIEVTSISFGVMKDLNSYRLYRHIGAIQLSFLSDSYTWIENTQVTHTGLNGTNYMHETKLLNTVVARGLRIDFYPTYRTDGR